jgi:hypothetical protein
MPLRLSTPSEAMLGRGEPIVHSGSAAKRSKSCSTSALSSLAMVPGTRMTASRSAGPTMLYTRLRGSMVLVRPPAKQYRSTPCS